jgi:Zn-dependent protease
VAQWGGALGDLTLQHLVLRICAALLIVSVHGAALAAAANLLGDPGPRYDGRLTLNPLRHFDLVGGLLFVLFTFGWIVPVAVDQDRLRPGRAGLVAVVAAASCATIALAVLLQLVRPFALNLLGDTAAATFFVFVETVGQLCVSFTVSNLLPLAPLTGQHLLVAVWPRAGGGGLRRLQPCLAVLLALLILTGVIARLLAPAEAVLRQAILAG